MTDGDEQDDVRIERARMIMAAGGWLWHDF
jgi:hypothetical protein